MNMYTTNMMRKTLHSLCKDLMVKGWTMTPIAFSESNSVERSDCNPAGHSLDLFFDMPTSYSFLRVTLRIIVFVGSAHFSFSAIYQ